MTWQEQIEGHRVVASVSGGKDSTAMCLWLMEQGVEFDAVFADTGWEAPETYAYLRGPLAEALGRPVVEVRSEIGGMVEVVRRKAMFPSRVRRFCTEELKVKPLRSWVAAHAAKLGMPVVQAVGIRAGESATRAKMAEWDGYRDANGWWPVWRPLIAWSEDDVIAIHHRHGLAPNPLYLAGASRVGCWPCIYARKAEIKFVAERDPERIQEIARLEDELTAAAAARAAAKGVENAHPRTFFAGRGPGAQGGRDGVMPILDVVTWARTGKGGAQFELFDSSDPTEGCVRWGLCEGHQDEEDAA